MSKLEKFLKESTTLPEDAKKFILEAWNEEKKSVAADIRSEMKTRYQEDLDRLTEGLDSLMKEVIKEEMQPVYDEKRKLVEDRVKIRSALGNFSNFANEVLAEEVKQFRTERKELNESMQKFVSFSNNVLAEELKEFHVEKRQLVEQRVKLIAEGKQKIDEAQKRFVERASGTAAKFIEESIRSEFTNLRSELHEAKQNMFGRKIFEAFAGEFLQNQFKENSVLRKLNESIKAKEDEVLSTKLALQETRSEVQKAQRKLSIMEDSQKREKAISELTKPLNTNQKRIMESLLESTATENLKEDFNKYIKSVLKESAVTNSRPAVNNQAKSTLSESKEVTGNRKSIIAESEMDDEDKALLESLARNAGLNK